MPSSEEGAGSPDLPDDAYVYLKYSDSSLDADGQRRELSLSEYPSHFSLQPIPEHDADQID